MTVSVRPWELISADLRGCIPTAGSYRRQALLREAAVAGDALAAEVERWGKQSNEMSARASKAEAELSALSALTAVVAAVHTALDQYDKSEHPADPHVLFACVSAIAKAVER